MTTDTHLAFSVNINLKRTGAAEPVVTFPVVQGMSFITGNFRNAAPSISCPGSGMNEVSEPIAVGKSTKYRIKDGDNREWLIYVNPAASSNYDATQFKKVGTSTLEGPPGFMGSVQIAKNPLGPEGEAIYDKAAGSFVTEVQLTGTVQDTKGTYSYAYTKVGTAPLLQFCLQHHIQSLDPELKSSVTPLRLRTSTKGMATAVWGDTLSFVETNLPTSMSFGPWTPSQGTSKTKYTPEFLAFLAPIAERDLRQAMTDATPPDSMYFAGKHLAKLATLIWIAHDVLSNADLAATGLAKLKSEYARYVGNKQKFPLYYDDTWKGLVSNAGFTDPGADFGNTFYNDHHFHFGYFVYAAAVMGYVDPGWIAEGDNKAWTNALVKDFAESEYKGRDYPFMRAFDWWNGHSWATGLYERGDGKDQESTSEDGFAAFAVKMWGKTIGDVEMEKRGEYPATSLLASLVPLRREHAARQRHTD